VAIYTEKEIKSFAEKDLRISKLAIVKSLIEKLSLEDIYGVNKIIDLSEKYIDYVYSERKGDTEMAIDWAHLAEGLNLAKPNTANIKILNLLLDKYKQVNKASANPSDVITHIFRRFGKYPEKQNSIKIILESLKG